MPIHKVLAILVCVVGLIKPVRWCKVSNIFLILCTMSVKDLLLFSGELLKRLHESGIRIDDYKYVAKYIKDTLDDEDAADGEVFECFLAKCDRRGVRVDWEDML